MGGSFLSTQNLASGTTAVAVNANLIGISANTIYNFHLVAAKGGGTTYGANKSFTAQNTGAIPYYQAVLNSNPISYWRPGEASGHDKALEVAAAVYCSALVALSLC
jgi:hypothetical protein